MKIGEVAAVAGVSADTIRYYERLGLLPPAVRSDNGYRRYPESAVRRILVIRNAVRFGFSLKQLAAFLQARDSHQPPCQQVLTSAQRLLEDVEQQIKDLTATRTRMRRTLREWDARLHAVSPGTAARLLDALPPAPAGPRRSASTRLHPLRRRHP